MSDKNQTSGSFVEVENELKMLANGLGISSPHSGMFPLVRSHDSASIRSSGLWLRPCRVLSLLVSISKWIFAVFHAQAEFQCGRTRKYGKFPRRDFFPAK